MSTPMRVACFLANGFEDEEFLVPYQHLTQAGVQVEVMGDEKGLQLEGRHHEATVLVDKRLEDAPPQDYAALWIPGGHAPDFLRGDAHFVEWLKGFAKLGRPMAASGHGPQLWLTAGLVRGRKMTAWETVQGDLEKAGAKVENQACVLDGNWLSARKPEDMKTFTKMLLKMLL